MTQNFSFLISAPPSQDVSKPKSKQHSEHGPAHSASTTEQPTSQSVPLTSMAPPTTNHTPALLSDPIILPYPSNDHVFISKSFLSFSHDLSAVMREIWLMTIFTGNTFIKNTKKNINRGQQSIPASNWMTAMFWKFLLWFGGVKFD